jgi:hypothetical protein
MDFLAPVTMLMKLFWCQEEYTCTCDIPSMPPQAHGICFLFGALFFLPKKATGCDG